jgi:hypothetical protein
MVTAAAVVFAADMVQERLTVGMTIVADAAVTGAGKSSASCSRSLARFSLPFPVYT